MKKGWMIPFLVLTFLIFGLPQKSKATITRIGSEKFELSRSQDPQNISWSPSFKQVENGIRLQENKYYEYNSARYWLQSEPFPIGGAERPPSAAAMFVGFDGEIPQEFWRNTNVYLRYSTDNVHWSSWSNKNRIDADAKGYDFFRRLYEGDIKKDSSLFDVSVSMPSAARTEYRELSEIWRKSNNYAINEHLFCVWLAKNNPAYFEREIPLIGYVQFRVEGSSQEFNSSLRIDSIYFGYIYSVSGLGYFDPIDDDGSKPSKTGESKSDNQDSEGLWHFDINKYKTNSQN